ncbi:hypothetical protein Tco_0733149 [Tanacetum coccineum]
MAFCTNLQTKVTNMEKTIKARALEIKHLKTRVQHLKDGKKSRQEDILEDAPNRGGVQDQGEEYAHGEEEEVHREEATPEKEASKSTDKDSESTGDLANVLTSMGVANILANVSKTGVNATATQQVPTASTIVSTISVTFSTTSVLDSPAVPTVSPIPSLSTSTVVTRRKGKEKMVEEESPKKSKKDLRSEQLARELAEKFELEDERRKEQFAIDERIARIEAERELQAMIKDLDRSDEAVNKHMEEYEQHQEDLLLEEKIELIQVLLDYQQRMSHVKRFKDQQQKLTTKAARKKFYMAVLRSHNNWKAKHFKGMTFDQIEAEFIPVWESIQHFEPIDFSPKGKGVKRSGEELSQEPSKKSKTQGLSKEQIETMMQVISVEEVYPETLVVKRPILGWYVHTEGQLKRWKIIRVGEFTELYQSFEDLVKAVDRKDLDTLWKMAQELQESGKLEDPKEMELWVELKRLYEPDNQDSLWKQLKKMHEPLQWKLYELSGVHHVTTDKGYELFMLREKDYPLSVGIALLMISNKLQVECYSDHANELIKKIYKIANQRQ